MAEQPALAVKGCHARETFSKIFPTAVPPEPGTGNSLVRLAGSQAFQADRFHVARHPGPHARRDRPRPDVSRQR